MVASALQTGGIWPNAASSRTVPSMMRSTTGTTFEKGGKYPRLESSTQPHYFSSLEKWLKLVFDGDSQGNVVQSHTWCNTSTTGFDYGIMCLRPYPQDFELVRHEAVVLIGGQRRIKPKEWHTRLLTRSFFIISLSNGKKAQSFWNLENCRSRERLGPFFSIT